MKKFLAKRSSLIVFTIFAVLFIATYLCMMLRPVSHWFNYVYAEEHVSEYGEKGTLYQTYIFKSDKILKMNYVEVNEFGEYSKASIDLWIYRDKNKICLIGIKDIYNSNFSNEEIAEELGYVESLGLKMSEKEYNEEIKNLKQLKKNNKTEYNQALEIRLFCEANIFKIKTIKEHDLNLKDDGGFSSEIIYGETLICKQAIVFTIVHGIFTLTFTIFALGAIIMNLRNRI